jgi:short-subunit dehydrogenase
MNDGNKSIASIAGNERPENEKAVKTSQQADAAPRPRPATIITGASHGIGRALADEFANAGCHLVLIARGRKELEKAAGEILKLHAAKEIEIFILPLDLTQPESCARGGQFLADNGLYCQHLVNCAGFGLAGPFHEQPAEELDRMVALNMAALTSLSRSFLPGMIERGEGGILNVASLGGLLPGPGQAAYYASKAYVISLSQALSWECWGAGVRISVLLPGPVRTRFHRVMGAKSALYIKAGGGISARRAAHMGFSGFMCGKNMIIPSILSALGSIAIKIIPHDLLMPLLAWFLRGRTRKAASGESKGDADG